MRTVVAWWVETIEIAIVAVTGVEEKGPSALVAVD